jgi:hypothetical protein
MITILLIGVFVIIAIIVVAVAVAVVVIIVAVAVLLLLLLLLLFLLLLLLFFHFAYRSETSNGGSSKCAANNSKLLTLCHRCECTSEHIFQNKIIRLMSIMTIKS